MTLAPDLFRPLLSEYLDGELLPADSTRLEAHLADCAGCSAELAQLRAASQALRAARHEPSASAIHAVRGEFRGALEEQAAGGGWSFRLLPQLAAAGMAAVLLIAAGAIMIPRMSHHESRQAKNSVVYIRPEESGSAGEEKAVAAAGAVASTPAPSPTPSPAPIPASAPSMASPSAPPISPASAASATRETASPRSASLGSFAPSPAAQPSTASPDARDARGTLADAEGERKKALCELECKTDDRPASAAAKTAAKTAAAPPPAASTRSRTAAAGPRAEAQSALGKEKDEAAHRTLRYAVMPKVAISNLWVRGAGGDAAAPATGERAAANGAPSGTGAGAGAPPAAEPGLARRADCHPAPPEFPAFPGLHAGDADRLPLTVAVTVDGGGHVIKVEPRAGPAQMPLALEIRNWLRGQRVLPMICNGEGVAATLTLTFAWPEE